MTVCVCVAIAAFPLGLFVAPDGDDGNPGTEARPLATLAGARAAVRKLKKEKPGEDIVVWFDGGTYRLSETVVFGPEDSAADGRTVTYSAMPGKRPVLTSGVPITGWRKLTEYPDGLPAKARGKVYVADAPEGLGRFYTLFDGEERLPRARCKGFTPTNNADGWGGPDDAVHFPEGAMKNWDNLALLTMLRNTGSERAQPGAAVPHPPDSRAQPGAAVPHPADCRAQPGAAVPHPPDSRVAGLPTKRCQIGFSTEQANLSDVEVCIVGAAPWTMNVLPLASVDTKSLVARTAIRGTYCLAKPRFGKFQQGSVFVENVFEGLDAPGSWVLDSRARKVYLWPRGDRPGRSIVAPKLTEFIRVEGRIDYDGPRDTPVRGIVFRGLTFLHGECYTWRPDQRGLGLQHDWEMFDRSTAMVRFRGAEGCAVEACRFASSGATAVRLDLHCQNNRITSNLIEHVGGAGILLAGYGPGTKDVNKRNEVVNNHIRHVGETYWHSAAIFAWQSGENRIANNLIHNVPYTAIVVSGRIGLDRSGNAECSRTVRWAELDKALGPSPGELTWKKREPFLHSRKNIVELNEIRDVMEMIEDGNCIYVSGCGGGNVVRQNYLHDCMSPHMAEGIRCDDDQHETIVDGNVLWRIGGLATYIAIKGVNHVTNNIMACPGEPTFRGMLSLELWPVEGSVIQRNILYATHKNDILLHQGMTYAKKPAWLRECKADYNVYWNAADPAWGERHLAAERPHGIERHSVAADPLFVNVEKGDFRLKKDSPALKLGFKPIDMKAIGLTGKVGPGALPGSPDR